MSICFVFSCNSTDWSTHSRYLNQGSVNCPAPHSSTDDFAFVVVRTRICDQRPSSETSLRPRLPTDFATALSGKKLRLNETIRMLKYFSIHFMQKFTLVVDSKF